MRNIGTEEVFEIFMSIFDRIKKKNHVKEISPDEIFVKSDNLYALDADRFEGRMEYPIGSATLTMVGISCACIGLLFFLRVCDLALLHHDSYVAEAESNRLDSTLVFAERGIIRDRYGVELAWNSSAATSTNEHSTRSYTNLRGLGHVLGYAQAPRRDRAGIYYQHFFEGVSGVELSFDALLRGTNGTRVVETDARLGTLSETVLVTPKRGEDLTLTLDAELTSELYNMLEELAERIPFHAGAAALMDVHTGEILALTSFPEVPSQVLSSGDAEKIRKYQTDSRQPFLDRVLGGVFTPGSVVKTVVAYGALSEGVVTPKTTFLSTGALLLANPYLPGEYTRFSDWKAHGLVDMRRALAVSSDVYFYYVGGGFGTQRGIGIKNIEKYARMFGYGSVTGIALEGEKSGTVPSPAWKESVFPDDPVWRIGNTYHTAIGQYGFQATPLQVLRATAVFANGGYLVRPRLSTTEEISTTRVAHNDAYISVVDEGMRQGVTEGTAIALNVPYVKVAAKTGTAELGVHKEYVNSWVTGYFPYNNPKYAFVVLMERGPRANLIGASSLGHTLFDWLHEHRPEYLGLAPT